LKGQAPVEATVGGFGPVDATGSTGGDEFAHAALALLFFTLYLATGAMAAWAAFGGYDPQRVAFRRAQRQRRRAERRRALHVAHVAALEAIADHLDDDTAKDDERFIAATSACEAWSQELREHARVRMAIAIGHPAGTSALT
jgi:hypothetical protein